MIKNKLGSYLTSFTDLDWISYHKFSKSLYSENSDYQRIINYIKKHKNQYDPSYMDSEYLRKKIRPNANKKVFATTISNLCRHIEKYITWNEIESDPMMKDTLLLQALGKRGLTHQFHKHKRKSKNRRDKLPNGLWNHYHDFMAEHLLYYCNMTSDILITKAALNKAFEEMKNFCCISSHYLTVEMQNREVVLKENWDRYILEFNTKIKTHHELDVIFDHLNNMKVKKSEESYVYLLHQVKNPKLSIEIRHTILVHLRSYISHKTVKGESSYRSKLIELQKYGLENNILFINGKIPALRFINIIHRACDMKEYNWAIEFMDKYSKLVHDTAPALLKALGMAEIAFSKCDFQNVLRILANTKYRIFEQEIRAKWLILSANYELNKNNDSIMEYNINNFKYFLKRNRKNTTELAYVSNLNTIKHLTSIIKNSNHDQLLNSIDNDKNLAYRKWLRSKAIEKINKK